MNIILREKLSDFRIWALAGATLLAALTFVAPTVRMTKNVYHWLLVIDITQSQNAEDYLLDGKPVSRLAFAKHSVRQAIRDLPCGSTVGIALFAAPDTSWGDAGGGDEGPPPNQMPKDPAVLAPLFAPIEVCRNFSSIDGAVEQIDWRMAWWDGSGIASGLFLAIEKTKDAGAHVRVAFFTDGEREPENGYIPSFSGKKGDVRGLIVGVGGLVPVPIPKFDEASGARKGYLKESGAKDKQSVLAEKYLKNLETETGLAYERLETSQQLSASLRSDRFAEKTLVRVDVRWIFGSAALVLVLIAILL